MHRNALLLFAMLAALAFGAVSSSAGCGRVEDVHETDEAKNSACVSCHRAAYVATTSPKHEGRFPDTCNDCHSTAAWVPTKIDFHESPSFQSKPCVGCHKDKYDGAKDPVHVGRFPETCKDCHTTKAWKPAVGFHSGPEFLSKQCVDCHKAKYDATSKPVHAGMYPENCADCHSTSKWTPPYRPIHETETAKVTICSTCHLAQYKAATNPPHDGIFPTQCAGCHGQASWKPAVNVSHDWFPLNNKHATLQCTQCHTKGFARGANPPAGPQQCYGCHQKNFEAATNPSHAGFSTECTRCHSDAGWKPFFHGGWLLTGKHTTAPCTGCHTGTPPTYVGTPKDCFSCHQANYNAAASTVSGHNTFPTLCTNCHTTAAWKPAQGGAHPEAKFPIANGAHKTGAGAKIGACTDCHKPALGAPQAGKNTDCVGCHLGKHTRTSMDAKHKGVKNYPLGAAPPNFCLACHPNGKH